uniref:PH domain-containing protein n=1 Tax=Schistosoma japonicum TaxID=6182 RepID=C1LJ49_SCHJA|nr:hypothetical protein [Schistosoma japonicum]
MSIKEGYLKKWSDRKNWHNVYCKLLNSGWFQWFDNASSTSPKRSVDIRRVAAFLAFGEVIHRVPCKPTSLTASEIPLAFGVPYEPHMGTQMAWFVCPDQGTLSSWTNAIMSLFQQNNSAQPPPPYQPPAPAAPPGVIGFGMPDPAAYGGNYGGCGAPPPVQPNYGYPPNNNYIPPAVPLSQPPVPAAAPGAYVPGTSSYGGYPQQQPPQAQQGQYFVGRNGQPYQVVYVDGKQKKKKYGGLKNAAVGLASGVAGGYLASRLFGGWGWGGGCGGLMGPRWDSWSSLSSLSWSD